MKSKNVFIVSCAIVLFIVIVVSSLIIFNESYRVVAKTLSGKPQSFVEIYKGPRMIYKFAPVVPESIGYPRPLIFEKAQRIGRYFVTSWGETGADYFGSHPVVIGCSTDKCAAVNVYNDDLSGNASIKDYSWTRKDFFVTNYFDPSERIKTILTQAVEVIADNYIVLSFYADELPHAADHKYVRIKIPLLSNKNN